LDLNTVFDPSVIVFEDTWTGSLHPGVTRVVNLWDLKVGNEAEDDIPFVENQNYHDIKRIISNYRSLWVGGPAGSGKSRPIKEASLSLGLGFYRINMNGHTTDEGFVGAPRIKSDDESKQPIMYWMTGMLEKAMTHGLDEDGSVIGPPAVFLIDEFAAAPPETHFVLQRVMETEKTLVIDSDGGRMVKGHPLFTVVAADNTIGTGDILGGYSGVNAVNFATRDRFDYLMNVDYDYPTEKKILLNLLTGGTGRVSPGTNDLIDKMQDITREIRNAANDGAIAFPMSIRRLISWARGIPLFGDPGKAFIKSVGNYLEDDQRNSVNEMFQRKFGCTPDNWKNVKK